MSRRLGPHTINTDAWLHSEDYLEQRIPSVSAVAPFTLDAQFGMQRSDVLWTRSRFVSGDPGVSAGTEIMPITRFWWMTNPLGAGGWSRISGITKNAAGAVLGGCAVHLLRTADDVEVDQVVSDAGDGTYSVGAPTDDTYYAVAYLPGSPDVAGTTVNTLTGS
jgi:hypothetical protein